MNSIITPPKKKTASSIDWHRHHERKRLPLPRRKRNGIFRRHNPRHPARIRILTPRHAPERTDGLAKQSLANNRLPTRLGKIVANKICSYGKDAYLCRH